MIGRSGGRGLRASPFPTRGFPLSASSGSVTPEVREHRKYTAMVFGRGREAELHEDRMHVCLHGLRTEKELLSYSPVGAPLGHQHEDVAFSVGQLGDRILSSRPAHELGNHLGIDRRS